ncbi:uncharacterized protein METZ01_LOCUS105739 [marine metagenome]|uniref:DUF541 domain-containing protein n=1 Tax=marine metagenome TaxID=408172 RepID=A0A381WK43_9ZZZZ
MMKKRLTLFGLLISTLIVLSCGDSDQYVGAEKNDLEVGQTSTQLIGSTTGSAKSGLSTGSSPTGSIQGIAVTGSGVINTKPDLAVLSLGIESRGQTVGSARSDAAEAMARLIISLEKNKVRENHIKTDHFNIYPEYTYEEIYEDGNTYSRQKITGYRVSNSISVQTSDLERVGEIIDDAALAVGDAIRINGINFTIENTESLEKRAMAMAVSNVIDKADRISELANVKRGALIYITNQNVGSATNNMLERSSMSVFSDYASTPINVGQLTIEVTVDALFGIIN